MARRRRSRKSIVKRVLLGGLALVLAAAAAFVILVNNTRLPGEGTTPAGITQSTAQYVIMQDRTPIAVTIWLPPNLEPEQKVPVLMRTTRYWRSLQTGWGTRALVALHQADTMNLVDTQRAYFNSRGFVVLLVDARGSGASGGNRPVEYAPKEIADMGEVAGWAAKQPWSNGHVGTFGVSYDGNMAELAAVPNEPSVRAVMPLYDDFDTQALIEPGGVFLPGFLAPWGTLVAAMDRDDICGFDNLTGAHCWKTKLATPGVQPADDDKHGVRLAALVLAHHNQDVMQSMGRIEFRDDSAVTAAGKLSVALLSPYGYRKRIESSRVPMMVWCGWLDANPCDGALSRYKLFSNPQIVVIGAHSHGGNYLVDPFATAHEPPAPTREEQFRMQADFFANALADTPQPVTSSIHYYTMGTGAWHDTDVWPPVGMARERLYLSDNHSLSARAPTADSGSDHYRIDYSATTGQHTRWHTQLGGDDVIYPDRAAEDNKLLTYTSAPLDADLEVTGTPVLSLSLASTTSDGAIHAYLEDVAPGGRVTYVDEGIFRVVNRKETNPQTLPFPPLGPAHSYLRSDAEPLVPGQPATVRFSFIVTSVVLRKGHSIRLALAGADSGLFQRYPATGNPTWTVYRSKKLASYFELPVRKAGPTNAER